MPFDATILSFRQLANLGLPTSVQTAVFAHPIKIRVGLSVQSLGLNTVSVYNRNDDGWLFGD